MKYTEIAIRMQEIAAELEALAEELKPIAEAVYNEYKTAHEADDDAECELLERYETLEDACNYLADNAIMREVAESIEVAGK